MNLDDLKKHYKVKTSDALRKELGMTNATMTNWKKTGIPYQQQCVFYFESNHKLKVDKDAKK